MGSLRVVRIKALADLRRRRLQAFVVTTVLLLATGAATVALDMLLEAQAPYDQAFAAANGAHLVVDYSTDPSPREPSQRLGRSRPVTASAGPWPVAPADVAGASRLAEKGAALRHRRWLFAGRSDPGGPVDRITLSAGRWWQRPGEVVMSQTSPAHRCSVGDTITLRQAPASRTSERSAAPDATRGDQVSPTGPVGRLESRASLTETVVGIASSLATPGVFGWAEPDRPRRPRPGRPADPRADALPVYPSTPRRISPPDCRRSR